jgi:hypothetical protein
MIAALAYSVREGICTMRDENLKLALLAHAYNGETQEHRSAAWLLLDAVSHRSEDEIDRLISTTERVGEAIAREVRDLADRLLIPRKSH